MISDIIHQINMKSLAILVVGDLILDRFIFGNSSRISPEAPVPIVIPEREEQMLGGSGNVIKNLSNLGVKTSLCGVVGKDAEGDLLIEKLKKEDVNISNVLRLDSVNTTEKVRIIANLKQIVRLDSDMSGLVEGFLDKLVKNLDNQIQDFDGVIISDYGKGVCNGDFLTKIIDVANENNIPIFVDPKGSNWNKYQNADLITPNTKEAEDVLKQVLESDEDFELAGEKICSDYNIEACLITRGSDGMSFYSRNDIFHMKSVAKEVFDVSGAGDTVISAIAAGLLMNLSYKKAAHFSNQAAGSVVGQVGTSAVKVDQLLNLE